MANKPAPLRVNHLAAIHMAQKALAMSADDAVALKLAITGQASSKDMTAQQRARYLAHLAGLQAHLPGAVPARAPLRHVPQRHASARSADDPLDARYSKARALWHALHLAGVVHTDTDAALMAYVKRQTRLEHWRFLNGYQVNAVIEALKHWLARVPQGAATPTATPATPAVSAPHEA